MPKLYSTTWGTEAPVMLVVLEDEKLGKDLMAWLEARGARGVWARNEQEARDLMEDAKFLGVQFKGLLANYELNHGAGI